MKRLILALLAGLVSSLSFEPVALWPFAIIGLGVWYQLICNQHMKQRVLSSYFFGLGLLLPTQVWTGIYVGNLPWLLLCFGQAIFFMIPALFVGKAKRYNQIGFFSSYVVVEAALRTLPFTGFGWSRLGFSQIDSPLSAIYPLFGVVGVALLLAWFATVRNFKSLSLPVFILLAALLIPSPIAFDDPIEIALVQGGVVNLGLDFNDKPKEVFLRHVNQTQKSISPNQAELIVWPENSVDVDVFKNEDVMRTITQLSKDLETPILIGGVTNSPNPRNQSMLFNPDLKQVYIKRYLTPFGEYLPVRSLAEQLSPYAKQINDFQSGSNPVLFTTEKFQFRTLICYELLNDRFVTENLMDFLVVQTNNATFGDTAQLDQQLNFAKVRAAESSRYIAYVSTTGTTSFINAQGEIISELEKFKPGTLFGSIEIATGATYAQRYGWLLEPLAIILLLLMVISRSRGRT